MSLRPGPRAAPAPSPRRPSAKTTKLAQRMEALQEAEDARQVFVQCSGMHTTYIQWIIYQICFRTRWVTTPGSCAEFVIPALTNGITQHWENVVTAQAEIAVYAALFLTLYANTFLGGIAPADTTDPTVEEGAADPTNPRQRAYFGLQVGLMLGLFNIVCALLYRVAGAFLPRESDKLAVLWTFRWLPLLNVVLLSVSMIVGLQGALATGSTMMFAGDFCMPDRSLGYLDWYLQWVRESYPKGGGFNQSRNETVLNPWAKAADAVGITRPNNTKYEPAMDVGLSLKLATLGSRSQGHHPSFDAYEEFMAQHLKLKGGGCFGGRDRSPLLLLLLLILPLAMLASRSPIFYWFRSPAFQNLCRRTKRKAGLILGTSSADEDNAGVVGDPYDLSAIYQEYKLRAVIGQNMANKDANGDGIVKPVTEDAYIMYAYSKNINNILGNASAPTPIALDAKVVDKLQQAPGGAVDPEDLRQYAEDVGRSSYPFLDTVLREAGIADLGTRLKAIKALQGAEDDDAGTGHAPPGTVIG